MTAAVDVLRPASTPSVRAIARYAHGRDNNFNLLRMVAASLVVFTHAYGLTGNGGLEPLKLIFDISFGSWAVDIFFAVSGFLVCKSWDRERSPMRFAWARAVRIFPTLWVSIAVCVLVVGPVFGTLPAKSFFTHVDTWKFILANATLLPKGVSTILPGVFGGQSVNSPLWTLPYELKMYVLLLALGWSGLLYRRATLAALLLISALGFGWGAFQGDHEAALPQYCRFVFCFFAGAWMYLQRESVQLRPGVALATIASLVLAAALLPVHVRLVLLTLVTPYLSLYAALVPGGAIRAYNRLGDYSYGIYIYGYPMQLVVLELCADKTSTMLNFALSMIGTLALAAASWHLLESKALRLKLSTGRSTAAH